MTSKPEDPDAQYDDDAEAPGDGGPAPESGWAGASDSDEAREPGESGS